MSKTNDEIFWGCHVEYACSCQWRKKKVHHDLLFWIQKWGNTRSPINAAWQHVQICSPKRCIILSYKKQVWINPIFMIKPDSSTLQVLMDDWSKPAFTHLPLKSAGLRCRSSGLTRWPSIPAPHHLMGSDSRIPPSLAIPMTNTITL